jgi:biopolymer transport protein ExbB/TolQ
MESPYTTPVAQEQDAAQLARSKKRFGWAAVVFGVGVILPPLLGIFRMVIGMRSAFQKLEHTGSADPAELAGDISHSMLTVFWAMALSIVCLIPFIVFLVLFLRRSKDLRQLVSRASSGEN